MTKNPSKRKSEIGALRQEVATLQAAWLEASCQLIEYRSQLGVAIGLISQLRNRVDAVEELMRRKFTADVAAGVMEQLATMAAKHANESKDDGQ